MPRTRRIGSFALLLAIALAAPAALPAGAEMTAVDDAFEKSGVPELSPDEARVAELHFKAAGIAHPPEGEPDAALLSSACDAYRDAVETLLGRLPDEELPGFSARLAALPAEFADAFAPVVEGVLHRAAGRGGPADADSLAREFFPGYGEGGAGFLYRHGREVARETVSTEWVETTEIIVKNTTTTMYVEDRLIGTLKYFYPPLLIADAFSWLVNGHPLFARKVTFTATETLEFTMKQKMATIKVWYELHRAPKSAPGAWSLVGKSWRQIVEPAGEKIGTSFRVVK